MFPAALSRAAVFSAALLPAVLGLTGCGDDSSAETTAPSAVLPAATEGSPEPTEAEVAANEAAQAELYSLERRVEIEVTLDPADWAALREEGRSVIETFINPNAGFEYTYFSADVSNGRVRAQAIDHDPWEPRFVRARAARFEYLERLGATLGARFHYDSTLASSNIRQTWKAARWI